MLHNPFYRSSINELESLSQRVEQCESLDVLRGIEGMAGNRYFAALNQFFPDHLPFVERSRRPPRNGANALLSWTYTILTGEIDTCIRMHGLDPCIGVLHEISHGMPSLSLDLIEPLRAPVCDLLVLNLINHGIFKEDSFEANSEDGGVYLRKETHKDFFHAYETAMTRKFILRKGQPHTDFRDVIRRSVWSILRAMEAHYDQMEFFRMP